MPPNMMTAGERAVLVRLVRTPLPATDVKPRHAKKFINHGLAVHEALRLKITPKGQLEVLRQRFRGISTRRISRSSNYDFISEFEKGLKDGLVGKPHPFPWDEPRRWPFPKRG